MDRLVSGIETAERFCPYLSPLGGKEQISSAAAAEVVGSTPTRSTSFVLVIYGIVLRLIFNNCQTECSDMSSVRIRTKKIKRKELLLSRKSLCR
jgi:hypothetical protein